MISASVIMPCYNHGRFVSESASGILSQSIADLELIVVDDHSSDDSIEKVAAMAKGDSRVKLVQHATNQGASRSRNDGLKLAQGEFVAFCDADDIWEPDKLELQIAALTSDSTYGVAYSDSIIVDERGNDTGKRFSDLHLPPAEPSGDIFHELCVRNFINIQTAVVRRSCIPDSLSFDAKIRWVEDWWFWIQLAARSRFLYIPAPLASYRTHARSTNITQRQGYFRNRFKVFNRVLKAYPDLPPRVVSRIWYHTGCCLMGCGKKATARKCLLQALTLGLRRVNSWPAAIRPLYRLLCHGV